MVTGRTVSGTTLGEEWIVAAAAGHHTVDGKPRLRSRVG